MNIFDITKDKSTKLNKVKFSHEIKREYDKGSYQEKNLDIIIEDNNKMLKEILNDSILKDISNWCEDKIDNKKSDTIKKLSEWLNIWTLYLHLEENFNSTKLRKYERGDIIHVNFGFNIGSEIGGSHYAIVIEKNNDQCNETIMTVPLRSEIGELDEKEVLANLRKHEVLLGKNILPIGEAKNNYSIAKINQIKAISKLRITRPKKDSDIVYPIDKNVRSNILDKIDIEISRYILK